jgi:hypothetical protein
MAALHPSIESDEDIEAATSSDDENEVGDEIDPCFEFGGILVSVDHFLGIVVSRALLLWVSAVLCISFFLDAV